MNLEFGSKYMFNIFVQLTEKQDLGKEGIEDKSVKMVGMREAGVREDLASDCPWSWSLESLLPFLIPAVSVSGNFLI